MIKLLLMCSNKQSCRLFIVLAAPELHLFGKSSTKVGTSSKPITKPTTGKPTALSAPTPFRLSKNTTVAAISLKDLPVCTARIVDTKNSSHSPAKLVDSVPRAISDELSKPPIGSPGNHLIASILNAQ
jgi:hypothetical protein